MLYVSNKYYHNTIKNKCKVKANIYINQTEKDILVYNYDDENVSKLIKKAKSTLVPFSIKTRLENGSWTDGEYIYFKSEKIMKVADISLVGEHNLANILAALAIEIGRAHV